MIDVNINLFGNQFHISGKLENINSAKSILTNVYNKLSNEKIENMMTIEKEEKQHLKKQGVQNKILKTQVK